MTPAIETGSELGRPPSLVGADPASENRLLLRIVDAASSELDLSEVVRRLAALVTEATASDVCFVHLVDDERRHLVLAGATPPFDELAGTIELELGEGVAGWVAEHAEAAVVPNKWNDPRYRYIPALRGQDFTSMVSVPMLIGEERVVGVLNVHSREERDYDERTVILLGRVASLMARAVENARLYQRLADREALLARLRARTVEAQELERRRLAGEIHDGISQRLISLWYHLLAAEDAIGRPPTVRRQLGVAKNLATAALEEARTAIAALRPSVLDDLGLAPSLESLLGSLSGIEVDADVTPCLLPTHVEVALYRIAQEALQNVVKHADASHVLMSLTVEPNLVRLIVRDDGGGFSTDGIRTKKNGPSYGMEGMRERAQLIDATLTVTSAPGAGTVVQVVVPVPEGTKRQRDHAG